MLENGFILTPLRCTFPAQRRAGSKRLMSGKCIQLHTLQLDFPFALLPPIGRMARNDRIGVLHITLEASAPCNSVKLASELILQPLCTKYIIFISSSTSARYQGSLGELELTFNKASRESPLARVHFHLLNWVQ